MRLIRELRSHLHYKIILPFLLLTLLVALAGSAVSFLLIVGTAQERLNNQLAQVTRDLSDKLVQQESDNLVFLHELVFAQASPKTGAPAVADALAGHDIRGLESALDPYFRISIQRGGVRVDRLMVFDTAGQSMIDWERPLGQADPVNRISHDPRDISALWFVPRILEGQRDEQGDKYAGLLDLGGSDTRYLFSVAPVVLNNQVVGGMLIATRLDTLLQDLNAQSQAAIIALYQAEDGRAFASTTVPAAGLAELNIRPDLVPAIRDLQLAEKQSIYDVGTVNQRNYQFAYAPLRIRGSSVGLIAAALARDYVTGPWSDAGVPLTILTISLMLAIIGLGIFIARQITRPLQELVSTAQAVTAGDLERRSHVTVRDEVGILSQSFNEMTGHLLDLYRAVRGEASQRAAIVDSITDGVVVCNPAGEVQVLNRTTRALLGLTEGQAGPQRFEDIPLQVLAEPMPIFGEARAANLFMLGERVIRVAAAPVLGDDGAQLGDVYVLQDLTDEVTMDRAKNNFIATISHELRTPLTVLSGTSELLLRNMVGQLSEDQRALIESMRKHTMTMNALLNNVITIANLESGTLSLDLEPVGLSGVLDGVIWPIRAALAAKGLELVIDLPEDLPEVMADEPQLRIVLHQLLDNARRYTDRGWVSIRATHVANMVRVDITDTGRGISADFSEQLFTRFARGSEGINSSERGIGLGLAIARELIVRQEGQIWLEHTSDQGSTFSFTLPCIQGESYAQDPELVAAIRDTDLATAA